MPCARPAFLSGITSGFILSGVQLALGASMKKATSWAVGSFVAISVLVYEGCHHRREKEKETVRMIQEALDRRTERTKLKVEQERARRAALELKEIQHE